MKIKIRNAFASTLLAACCVALTTACGEDDEVYTNKVYVNNPSKVGTILLKGTLDNASMDIETKMGMPEEADVRVTYQASPDLVEHYNGAYYDHAVLMPAECYEIADPVATINQGSVRGNDVTVNFKNLSTLDKSLVYVLPVSICQSDVSVLQSAKAIYFVAKEGALINTAANITSNYLALDNPSGAAALGGLEQLTAEALVRVSKFGKLISTIMGIEGSFLIRIGDSGLPDNQIQLACSNNVTDPGWTINTGEWTHIALTYDKSTGEVNVYLNGKKMASKTTSFRGNVNWNSPEFYIGKSYDDQRWLEGEISECRVWNRVLTSEEINAPYHFYAVDPASEGLVAYWKFDEGAGKTIKDHANGYGITAHADPVWKTVSLPEKK
ncbi:MAG: DUF1735 and LamG domain-containing protein [Mediterranea sp.]|jgi:hypothetical protein|nr:DUF1735 and LamG domain-containing protein [Mediterranea sp.]